MMYDPYDDVWDAQEERLLDLCERIKQYTCAAQFQRRIVIREAYIEQGIADLENYLAKYAAFEEFMEGSETDA